MKKFIQKLLPTFLILITLLTYPTYTQVLAQPTTENSPATNQETESQTTIHVFERNDCQHCQDQKAFLEQYQTQNPNIIINWYDIDTEQYNQYFSQITEKLNISQSTPVTIIGDTYLQGFESPETTGLQIQKLISESTKSYSNIDDLLSNPIQDSLIQSLTCSEGEACSTEYTPYYVKAPLVGEIDIKQYTLGTMSLILGFIDGFNPCAMWVLVTFLLILIQIGDKRKMLEIAGLFILAETIMYYLILNVWLTTWNFVGLDNIITIIVGTLAIGGGIFFLYEWKTSDGTCKVTNIEQRTKTRSTIKQIANSPLTIATAAATIGLALSVNIIEFACSIGIPQTFTKILDINPLTTLQKQFYMFLYIIMYMIDDFIVFGLALYSIEKIGLATKYSKWCNLIGGILMLILGIILILKPELLVL